jgi:hypothetical protein
MKYIVKPQSEFDPRICKEYTTMCMLCSEDPRCCL